MTKKKCGSEQKPHFYGGMAVIEGVMMRGKTAMATAVRVPDGSVSVRHEEITTWNSSIWQKPFFRGNMMLLDSLITGMKALAWSANESAAQPEEKLSKTEIGWTLVLALSFAIGLFMILPTLAVHWLAAEVRSSFLMNLLEGVIRVFVFFLYVWGISHMKDIQRVFCYHGAEHKTINAFEAGADLTVDQVRKYPRLHPRCGTTFLFIVMIISVFVFSFLGWPGLLLRILSRVVLLPVIAGISYEILKLSARGAGNRLIRPLLAPGMLFQKFTTREPDDSQLEVAIRALRDVLISEGVIGPETATGEGHCDASPD